MTFVNLPPLNSSLIASLQRAYHQEGPFPPALKVRQVLEAFNLGRTVGARRVQLAEDDRRRLRDLVLAQYKVDLVVAKPADWSELNRAEAAQRLHNDKITPRSVREGRVAIKALPGRALRLGGGGMALPDGASLDIDWQTVAATCEHGTVLVIENWLNFERVHDSTIPVTAGGEDPLVVFRGSPVYSQAHTMDLLRALSVRGIPVWAYMDFDPKGLENAWTLPGFAGLVTPPAGVLEAHLNSNREVNRLRFQEQRVAVELGIARCDHPEIQRVWRTLRKYGAAVPQELFLGAMRSA